jgi:hypothetical protein
MQNAQVASIARGLKQKDAVHLQQRRARLALMLTAEDEAYRIEFMNQAESAADRAKRLVKEARRLKGEREEKRKAFADEQLERQWKYVARGTDTRGTHACMHSRAQQLY